MHMLPSSVFAYRIGIAHSGRETHHGTRKFPSSSFGAAFSVSVFGLSMTAPRPDSKNGSLAGKKHGSPTMRAGWVSRLSRSIERAGATYSSGVSGLKMVESRGKPQQAPKNPGEVLAKY
jgi:hypothetical protein